MSIRAFIAEKEKEDMQHREADRAHFDAQQNKYEELHRRLVPCEAKAKTHIESIETGLQQLMANRYSIEKALKHHENPNGLPIPLDHHETVKDLLSKMTSMLNNPELLNHPDTRLLEKIQNDVITITQNSVSDLEDFRTSIDTAKALYCKTKELQDLSNIIERN